MPRADSMGLMVRMLLFCKATEVIRDQATKSLKFLVY